MGERKVLNKYYPPDFDPSLIPRMRLPKDRKITVRIMTPMSMQCLNCGEFIYQGKKFNSMKEVVKGEDYLGIRIFRFYMKCPACRNEITFKTDPKNSDYTCESGAQRNFELWRETEKEEEKIRAKREEEEEGDAMKALENRTKESKREMDELNALAEIRDINARHARIDHDRLLNDVKQEIHGETDQCELDEEDEKAVKEALSSVKRVDSDDEDKKLAAERKELLASLAQQRADEKAKKEQTQAPVFAVKKRKAEGEEDADDDKKKKKKNKKNKKEKPIGLVAY